MKAIYHKITDIYRLYGINHFIQRYGIPLNFINFDIKSRINMMYGKLPSIKKVDIQITENEIQNNIIGYLKTGTEEIPLFEKPKRFDENGESLVMFVDNEGNEYPCIISKDNMIKISFDIFNEVGHILTGHLERFWASNNLESKQLMKIPVVDFYEKILFDCIKFASGKLDIQLKCKPFWPDGKKFAVCLTHDVDRVHKSYQYITHFVRNIGRGDFRSAMNQITSVARKLQGDEPYWNFNRIMEIEKNLGVKSTFFFLNEQKKACVFSPNEWKLYRGRYDIKDKRIVEMIKTVSYTHLTLPTKRIV